MKISCKIIEDLLPLYYDGICSKESEELVKEHLNECEYCNKILEVISATPKIENKELIKPLKGVSDKWLKSRKKSIVKGLIIGVSICLVLILSFIALTQWRFITVDTDKITISDVYELSDGQIAFHLYIDDNYNLHHITSDITEDGVMYIKPKRSVIEDKRMRDFNKGLFNRDYVVSTRENIEDYTDFNYVLKPLTAVYIGTENDSILIWDENTTLPKANSVIQQRYTDNNS